MRPFIPAAFLASSLFSMSALAAPGYSWEIGMEMEGMPFAMPKQKVCSPKDSKEPPVSRDGDDCKTLEKKLTGNRFYWKAQCKDGLMVGDITSTPSSYHGSMKMTEKSGETMTMKISGKRLGECDYKDPSGEIRALQKQSEDMMTEQCQNALEQMQGHIMGSQCPKETPIYCQRIATLEGFDKATRNMPLEMINDPNLGSATLTRACKLNNAKLLPKLCASAVSASNFSFVSRLCPAERPKLCAKAASDLKLAYVGANCPAEKAALLKTHCEGRKYSSDIEPRFVAFCSNTGMFDEVAQDDARPAPSATPTETIESKTEEKIQKSIKSIRGLFGF